MSFCLSGKLNKYVPPRFTSAIKNIYYKFTPGRYIDFKEAEEDGQAFDEKMKHLTATLEEQMNKAKDLDDTIKNNLSKIGYGF